MRMLPLTQPQVQARAGVIEDARTAVATHGLEVEGQHFTPKGLTGNPGASSCTCSTWAAILQVTACQSCS